MAHPPGDVIFVVNDAGHCRYGPFGRDLFDEDHAAPPAVFSPATDVKPQVDLFEVSMKRNRQAEDTRLQEQEADDADEMAIIPRVEFDAARDERTQDRGMDFIVNHRQPPPFSPEKFSRLHLEATHRNRLTLRHSLNQ